MTKRRPLPRIVYRKLGKEWAWGQAYPYYKKPIIEIDPRLSARRMLEVICHEALHIALPHLTDHPAKSKAYKRGEAEVDRLGKAISAVLWKDGYRKVLLAKHHTPVLLTRNKVVKPKKKNDRRRNHKQ
jgi:hypothetical protein